jgi:hypothetical protein
LFAADHLCQKIDPLGDPLVKTGKHIDFAVQAAEVDRTVVRPVSRQGQ